MIAVTAIIGAYIEVSYWSLYNGRFVLDKFYIQYQWAEAWSPWENTGSTIQTGYIYRHQYTGELTEQTDIL
jgi:hypothetical protein